MVLGVQFPDLKLLDHPPLRLILVILRLLHLVKQPLEDPRIVLNVLLDLVSRALHKLVPKLHAHHLM